MAVFKVRIIYISDRKHDFVSNRIREDMKRNLADGGSNEELINLAFDLQLIEMAWSEGVPTYDEDDLADTITRLVEVMDFELTSVEFTRLNEKEFIINGDFRE
jgi:hypothetical protein